MGESVILQLAALIVVPVLGAGWAIVRYEAQRYAAAHPGSPVVSDVERLAKEAATLAPIVGVTPERVATFAAGYLTAHGEKASAASLLSGVQKVQAAAAADTAAIASAAPSAPAAAVPSAPAPIGYASPPTT